MAKSQKTKALEIAFNKALKDYKNIKDSRPKPTWSMNQRDRTSEEAINRLIKQAPAGSAQRQQLMADKAAYKAKFDAWQVKFDQATTDFNTSRDAFKASEKLEPLLKKQQDNKDTGVVDEKTDSEIKNLEKKVEKGSVTEKTPVTPVTPKVTPTPEADAAAKAAAEKAAAEAAAKAAA
jgi:hypothetical protein